MHGWFTVTVRKLVYVNGTWGPCWMVADEVAWGGHELGVVWGWCSEVM